MEVFITGLIAFASTNLDDIFILLLFYGDRKYTGTQIVIGQLLGITVLILISLVTSLAGLIINKAYIGLLGLFPVYLGIKGILKLVHPEKKEEEDEMLISNKNNISTVSGVTIANGGDNIGIYVPIFATLSWIDKSIMVGTFLLMTLVWCVIAKYLTKHPFIAKTIQKYGHIVIPFVLILLGLMILNESGTLALLKGSNE